MWYYVSLHEDLPIYVDICLDALQQEHPINDNSAGDALEQEQPINDNSAGDALQQEQPINNSADALDSDMPVQQDAQPLYTCLAVLPPGNVPNAEEEANKVTLIKMKEDICQQITAEVMAVVSDSESVRHYNSTSCTSGIAQRVIGVECEREQTDNKCAIISVEYGYIRLEVGNSELNRLID